MIKISSCTGLIGLSANLLTWSPCGSQTKDFENTINHIQYLMFVRTNSGRGFTARVYILVIGMNSVWLCFRVIFTFYVKFENNRVQICRRIFR